MQQAGAYGSRASMMIWLKDTFVGGLLVHTFVAAAFYFGWTMFRAFCAMFFGLQISATSMIMLALGAWMFLHFAIGLTFPFDWHYLTPAGHVAHFIRAIADIGSLGSRSLYDLAKHGFALIWLSGVAFGAVSLAYLFLGYAPPNYGRPFSSHETTFSSKLFLAAFSSTLFTFGIIMAEVRTKTASKVGRLRERLSASPVLTLVATGALALTAFYPFTGGGGVLLYPEIYGGTYEHLSCRYKSLPASDFNGNRIFCQQGQQLKWAFEGCDLNYLSYCPEYAWGTEFICSGSLVNLAASVEATACRTYRFPDLSTTAGWDGATNATAAGFLALGAEICYNLTAHCASGAAWGASAAGEPGKGFEGSCTPALFVIADHVAQDATTHVYSLTTAGAKPCAYIGAYRDSVAFISGHFIGAGFAVFIFLAYALISWFIQKTSEIDQQQVADHHDDYAETEQMARATEDFPRPGYPAMNAGYRRKTHATGCGPRE